MDSLRWKRFAAILTISLLVPSTCKPGSSGGRASASPLFNFFGRNRDRQRGPVCRRGDNGQNRAGVNETAAQQPADTEPVVPIKAGSSNDHAQQGTWEFGDDSLSGNIHECDLECGSSKGTDGSCNVSAGWCFGKGRKETSTDSYPPVAEAAAATASANGKPAAQAEGVRLLRPSDARKRNAGGPKPAAYAYEAATASAHRAAPSFTPVPSAAAAAVKEVAAAAAASAPLSAGIRGGTGGKGGSSSSSSSGGGGGGGGEDAAAASDGAGAQQQGYYDGSAQEWEQQQQQQPAAAYEGGGAAGAYAGYEGDADGGYAALEAARQNAAAAGAVNPLDVDYAARVLDYALYHNGLMDDDMATPRIRFISALSCLKLSIIAAIGTAVAYASVSPRNAPREVYMQLFQRNLLLLGTSLVGPGLFMLTLHDSSKASANAVISAFFHAFTWGYLLAVLLELVLTTVYRMAVLQVMEPQAYNACPDVPAIWLPWVLRDHGYYLKPLTAFVANFAIFCLGTPWIEEAVKVWTTRWTGWLPKRPAALAGAPATLTAVHVHTYVVLIVAAAMGLKVADNARRILLYTRHTHRHKFLFALLRGFFPLQELCAALTAMNLARRDILGEKVPAWRVYLPAAALHAWANFRGTAPIVKWSADAPWVELQMGAWSLPDGITAMQLLHRGLVSLLWFSILLKVLSYTIKTYWRLSRLHNSRLRRELFR